MFESLNVWVIKRNGETSESFQVIDYEISIDYLTNEKSSFELLNNTFDFSRGDFLLAKFKNGGGVAFFGLIDSYENNKVICNDIYNLMNFDFPATRISGKSFEQHAKNLISNYLINDNNKQMKILDVAVMTDTSHLYQPSEPPTPTNIMKYLINAFKKYNVVWRFDDYQNKRIKTSLVNVTDTIQFKNNLYDFVNWDVSTTEVGRGIDNHLMIINKTTKNSEVPTILSQWWLTTENEVTQDANDPLIERPTKTKVYVYDTTEEDKPTYQEVAESEIKGSYYSHEISFEVHNKNKFIDFKTLKIGTLANIYYNDTVYQSVLTGYTYSNASEFVQLRFGHIRSRLSEILE